ncbi:MAG TPA: PAS domain S-box protein, partial [Candidatus Krumholzibacteria bacterium]|nr:PAS domain S-box protein [Candidatus Krumholzibacteria bacterium]
ELETSKEELQSVNEELQAVNYELKGKLDEISRAHSDLENLMAASEIATLFLDRELRIVRSTPSIGDIFKIMGSDRGRSITDLAHNLAYDQLASDAERVLRDLTMVEREVSSSDGRWLLVRQRPYRTIDHKIDGVVITFMDITRLKRAEQAAVELSETLEHRVADRTHDLGDANQRIAEARDMFLMLFNANPIPTVLVRRDDGRFLNVNPAFLNLFQLRREDVIDHRPDELGFKIPALTKSNTLALVEQLDKDGSIVDFETELVWRGEEEITVLAHFQRVVVDNTEAVLIAFSDITVRKRLEQRLRDVIDATPDAMVVMDEDGRVVLVNPQAERLFGYSRQELIRKPMLALFSARYDGSHAVNRKEFFKLGEADRRLSLFAARSDGSEFPVEVTFSPLNTNEGQLVITAIRDVSERVKAEQQIRGLALNLTTAEQQERHRISQVLHDDLQQRLFAIKTHLSFMEAGLRKVESPQLHDEFTRLAAQLDEAISVTRNLSADMSPIVLQGEGLPDALLWLAQQMQERYGLHVAVRNGVASFALEKSLRVILFQAVREVLFNVAKHAGTSEATVSMQQLDGTLRITIEDRGKGFDVEHMSTGSTLLGIKRRLSLLGCQLEVASTPGKGTTVHIDVRTEPAEGVA